MTHYKMYKSGKHWIVAGIVSGAVVLGAGNATAHADEQPSADVESVRVTAESETGNTVTLKTTPGIATTITGEQSGEVPPTGENPETRGVTESREPTPTPADQPVAPEAPVTDTGSTGPTVQTSNVENSTNKSASTTPEPNVPQAVATSTSLDSATKTSVTPTLAAAPLVQKQLAQTPVVTAAPKQATDSIDQWMPNKTLQKVVLLTLQDLHATDKTWNSVADITQEDLLRLDSLNVADGKGYDTYIDGKTPFSLEGLQYAKNLTSFTAGGSLNIEPGAYHGDIVDVSPLANLQKLTTLELRQNRITDVSPLANLKNLKVLSLQYNHIRDFSPLKEYKGEIRTSAQFIMLDPLLVSEKDRTGHMQIQCKTITGEVVQLLGPGAILEPVFIHPGQFKQDHRIYHIGGNARPDGNGGLVFSFIQDQKPGTATPPAQFADFVNIIVQPDYYYLLGQYGEPMKEKDFYVVQPYRISTDAASVTVKYQDKDGKKLADDQVLPAGLIGEDYSTKPRDISGYQLVKTPENATGKYGKESIVVTYIYAQTAAPVTVHYQDRDGNKVAADEVLPAGLVGDDYTTKPADVKGYKLVTTPENATGTYGKESIEVTYIYAQTAASVTVHYQDRDGNKVAADEVLSEGLVGDKYTSKPATVQGYKLVTTPENATGTYGKEYIEVTYIYAQTAASVTVHYQDRDGKKVAADEVLSEGLVGDDYTTKPATVQGYKLVTTPENATGKYSKENIVVIYVYAQTAAPVTVHYQDKDGKKVAADEVLSAGLVGDDYTTTPRDVSGYKLVATPENATGKYSATPITVLYVYAKDEIQPPVTPPAEEATVTVHHQTADGKTVAPDVVQSGKVGTDYVTHPATPKGYKLVKTPANATGKYSATPITVLYVYAKDEIQPPVTPPAEQTTVTVHHQTADGKTVAPDVVQSGKVGTEYVTQPATPKGYKLVTTPANATGKFGKENIVVTYIYAPVETGGGETPGPSNPGDGGNGGSETPGPSNPDTDTTITESGDGDTVDTETPAKPIVTPTATGSAAVTGVPINRKPQTATILPQTGEQSTKSSVWGIIGLSVAWGVLGLLGVKRKMR
ncbi:MucBP domain-containing protein [Levilactobacillus enshiensis]|uniref:MucBP domain-containing protein n=1 Tax=Levilactobacillus enshiensis TaxID=2590213 RepID=UPI001CDB72D4|nr:MucBP domain-containing protein [Levilactobacillus enshiensis]